MNGRDFMLTGRRVSGILLSAVLLVTGFFIPGNTAKAAVSAFSTAGVSLPGNIYVGSSFAVKGTVSSDTSMNSITAGVVNTSGNWIKGVYATASPNSTKYNLSKLDSQIAFSKLSGGTFYYRVTAASSASGSKVVVNKKFTVKSMKLTGASKPSAFYAGKSFGVKGKISSKYKLTSVKAGVVTTAGKWVSGAYASAKPNAKTYSIARLDSRISFGRLSPGTYYYYVKAKNEKSGNTTLLKKKFTVSKFKASKCSKPGALTLGKGFTIKGSVKSAFRMTYVKVGIKTSAGAWKSGSYATAKPYATTYSVASFDSKIKFGSLSKGTYYYCIWCRDVNGVSKTVVKKKFTVAGGTTATSGAVSSGGTSLAYNSSLISSTIGAQKVSGPCGIYAMAYSRAVIDGTFTRGGYSSVYSRLINQYGHGSYCAYWSEAGGDSCYYTSAKSCYKTALTQVSSGKPCIINVRNGYTGNQHYVTVIGYTAGTTYDNVSLSSFIVLDPAYGTKKYLSNMKYYNNSSPQCITF